MPKAPEKRHQVSKNAMEWGYVERFRSSYPLFPPGELRQGIQGQEPDFVSKMPTTPSFGIEIAQIFRDEGDDLLSIQSQPNFQNRLVECAKNLFEKEYPHRYRVYISFQERSGITPSNQQELARHLSQMIQEAVQKKPPTIGSPIILGPCSLHPFENTFALVQIHEGRQFFDLRWTIQNAFSVDPINQQAVINRIHEKEDNLAKGLYGKPDKIWLLLCMDFQNHAMDQSFFGLSTLNITGSKFHKIIIFKTIENIYRIIFPNTHEF